MKKYTRIIFIALLGTMLFPSCKQSPGASKDAAPAEVEILPENIAELNAEQYKMAGVVMGAVEMKTLNSTIKANGIITVAPQNAASVCAPLGGFVKSTQLLPGSHVVKGQMLAIIENPEFIELQQNYLESLSRLEFAEGEYNRHKELHKEDVYSDMNLQEVTANYKTLKTQVYALSQKLALIGINAARLSENTISRSITVASPISGFVKSVNVNIGKYVSPTDVMFEIVNSSALNLELTVFEKDITKIAVGQKLRFTLSNDEAKQYTAVITQTGQAILADKTVKVYAKVDKVAGNILPGMYVNALIETVSNLSTALPAEAVVQFDEKDYIFIFERDKKENGNDVTEFKMIEVKRGITENGYTSVILPGDFDSKTARVVISGAYKLMAAKKNAGDMSCG